MSLLRGMSGSKGEEVAGGMRKFLEEKRRRCVLSSIQKEV
jgi:hypothetical protein